MPPGPRPAGARSDRRFRFRNAGPAQCGASGDPGADGRRVLARGVGYLAAGSRGRSARRFPPLHGARGAFPRGHRDRAGRHHCGIGDRGARSRSPAGHHAGGTRLPLRVRAGGARLPGDDSHRCLHRRGTPGRSGLVLRPERGGRRPTKRIQVSGATGLVGRGPTGRAAPFAGPAALPRGGRCPSAASRPASGVRAVPVRRAAPAPPGSVWGTRSGRPRSAAGHQCRTDSPARGS